MVQIDPRNPPNEMPDIVGFRPENPLAANFKPFIPAHVRLREFTPIPIILGTLLGIVFGASSLYLVLKVGITVSASIPVAVHRDHYLPRAFEVRAARFDHSREQHRPDRRLGG